MHTTSQTTVITFPQNRYFAIIAVILLLNRFRETTVTVNVSVMLMVVIRRAMMVVINDSE